MTLARRLVRVLRRHPRIVAPLALVVALLSFVAGGQVIFDTAPAVAIPVPLPVYDVEAFSNGHQASLLNLKLGQPGALQAPTPVDVDGDLIPDVLVSVNLIDAAQVFNNPPELGKLIAPNVVIERVVKGVPLGSSPPLRINVKLRIKSVGDGAPDTILRVGYDTGTEGSIPGSWKAVVRGLDTFFNPMQLVVDTKGGVVRQADTPFVHYEGPLDLIAGVEKGAFRADADLDYSPFPDSVRVDYSSDDAGQHFTYAHGIGNEVHLSYGTDVNGSNVRYVPGDLPEVDLTTRLKVRDTGKTTDLTASVDRLPRNLHLDLGPSGESSGSADLTTSTDGRPPDARLDVRTTKTGQRPLKATLDLDGLPSALHARWSLPEDGPAAVTLDAGGAGLGAVQADIRNYDGTPASTIAPFVPIEQQFLNLQQVGTDPSGPDRLITGRVERVRHLDFAQTANDGVEMTARVGDGELPLGVHVLADDRAGTEGSVLEGSATVAPLPDEAHVSVVKPADDTDDPLVVTYRASEAVDVDGTVELREAGAGPTCGDHGTLCASLAARHIPSQVVTTVRSLEHDTRIDIDSTLRDGGAEPDFYVDAQIGQDDDVPLIAHATVLGAPRYVRILAADGNDQSLERAEFHACDYDFDAEHPGCADGTDEPDDQVGALELAIRNWRERPTGLPAHDATTSSYFDITARGGLDPHDVRFEAIGRLTDIREVDFRSSGPTAGVRTNVGGGGAFAAHADLQNVALTPDDPVATLHRYDVLADVLVPTLPSELDVCFRQSGSTVGEASDTFLAPCEQGNPFVLPDLEDDSHTPVPAPMTFAYRANATFDIDTTGRVVDRGIGGANTDVADDHVISAIANVHHLPRALTLDVDAPEEGVEGPIQVNLDSDKQASDPQVSVDLDARQTDGDLGCVDPRVPAPGDQAMCVRAQLRNLPETARITYDPTVKVDNLIVHTTGAQQMDVIGFEDEPGGAVLSIVKRHEERIRTRGGPVLGRENPLKGVVVRTGTADVLLARGRIEGIPREITGTLLLPNKVDLRADPPLETVDLTIQNFIAPDPMPSSLPGPRSGVLDADQKVVYLQRGDHFRADVHVGDLRGAGFATAVDSTGKALDTKTMRVDFGPENHTVRAYADLLTEDESSPNHSLQQVIADVTLPNAPAGISLCFRGPTTVSGAPVEPTYCDSDGVRPEEGAFSVVTDGGPRANELDVNAFIRVAKQGGSSVLAARVDLENVPRVVQGTFDDEGKIVMGGFHEADGQGVGVDPDGIDRVAFDIADFDASGLSGYTAPPWEFGHASDISDFPVAPAGQNLRLRVTDNAMRAAGAIGDIGETGNLQALLLDRVACDAPPDDPPDYASYFAHAKAGTEFRCIRLNFDPGGTESPLLVDLVVDKGGNRIAFHDGGFSRIPDWAQVTIASVDQDPAGSGAAEATCGPAFDASGGASCLPPLVRLDTRTDAVLAGVLEVGSTWQLNILDGIPAIGPMTDLKAVPSLDPNDPGAWSDWANGSNPHAYGARVRMSSMDVAGHVDPQIAVHAGLRIAVPKSFTLDQVQTWSVDPPTEDNGNQAKDIKLHYTVRDSDGVAETSIGEAAAMIDLGKGKQVLLSGEEADNTQGFAIPGDLDLNVYLRHHQTPEDNNLSDPVDKLFAQIDGRVSSPISAKVRMSTAKGGRINALIKNVPALPAYEPGDPPPEPSFRVRFEMDTDNEESSIPDGGFFCLFLCLKTHVGLASIDATFDFANNGQPDGARRVDAFVNLKAPRIAIDVRAFRNIDPALDPSDDEPAEISGKAAAHLDPLDVILHAEFFVLGANFGMVSDLRAGGTIDRASRFQVTSNILHLKVAATGSGTSHIDTQFSPQFLGGELHSLLALFWGDPILYWFMFSPPTIPDSPDPAKIAFNVCPVPGATLYVNHIDVPGNGSTQNLFAWLEPGIEDRFEDGGWAKGFFLDKVLGPAFCILDADLMSATPAPPFEFATHPVPPVALPTPEIPADPVEPPAPDPLVVSVGPDREMCGEHVFGDVHILSGATLRVATVPGPDCPAADVGGLQLKSLLGSLTIDGTIEAAPGSTKDVTLSAKHLRVAPTGRVNATQGRLSLVSEGDLDVNAGGSVSARGTASGTTGGTGATGRNGAGHGGAGGLSGPARSAFPAGSEGSPGTIYGNDTLERQSHDPDPPQPGDGLIPGEAGSASATPSRTGGGFLHLVGDQVHIAGTVDVSVPGPAFSIPHLADCAVEGPGGHANEGSVGTGGGSGGTVVLAGHTVDLTGGIVRADGGAGGHGTGGGGGGGGGGVVKVVAPVLIGTPTLTGGNGGANDCPDDPGIQAGTAGGAGKLLRDATPVSRILPSDRLWFNHVPIDIQGAGQTDAGNPNVFVTTCGSWRPPQAVADGEERYGIDLPTVNAPGNPCGVAGSFQTYTGDSVVFDLGTTSNPGSTIDVSRDLTLAEGFWGLYSVATVCTGGFPLDCSVEHLPKQPDRVVGIDATQPKLTATLPGVVDGRTKSQVVTLDIVAPQDELKRRQALASPLGGPPSLVTFDDPPFVAVSGTDQIECSNTGLDVVGSWVPCQPGSQLWTLNPGSGPKTVYVQAFDRGGNINEGGVIEIDVELDNTPPTTQGRFDTPAGPDGLNGWFTTSPSFELYGYDEHGAPEPEPGKPRYRWWIDSGSAAEGTSSTCDDVDEEHPSEPGDACIVETNLSDGPHTFYWQGIDALENEETPHKLDFFIDGEVPKSQLLTSPAKADGANGWFVSAPWVVVSAVDQTGGSGLANKAADPDQTAGIYYRVNTEGQPPGDVHGPIAPKDFVPFRLGQGKHEVCWQSTDRAGNTDWAYLDLHCQEFKVDVADPTAFLNPAGVPGSNGWFTSLTSVLGVGLDNGSNGSGVDPTFVPGAFDLCNRVAGAGDPTPSGVCVSVDDGPWLDRAGHSDLIGEGLHDVRAYAIDVAGRHSPIARLDLQVDRSHPVSTIRTMPSAPAAGGWWRTQPTVVLRARDGDQNAGVSQLQYRLDGGTWTAYSAPFTVPEGIHTVDYRALDRSGGANDEVSRRLTLPVDLTAPVAKALDPSPTIWSKLLGNLGLFPAKAKLNFRVQDNLSHQVHIYVIVYDTQGFAARRIDGGIRDITPGVPYTGFVEWDGRDQSLTGFVGVGLYHFRVIAVDEAGNRTQTGESKPIQIKVL